MLFSTFISFYLINDFALVTVTFCSISCSMSIAYARQHVYSRINTMYKLLYLTLLTHRAWPTERRRRGRAPGPSASSRTPPHNPRNRQRANPPEPHDRPKHIVFPGLPGRAIDSRERQLPALAVATRNRDSEELAERRPTVFHIEHEEAVGGDSRLHMLVIVEIHFREEGLVQVLIGTGRFAVKRCRLFVELFLDPWVHRLHRPHPLEGCAVHHGGKE